MNKKAGKMILVVILLLGTLLIPNLYAYPVDVYDVIKFSHGYGTTIGGEFIVLSYPESQELFRTFCVETNEYLDYTRRFIVGDISNYAVEGGSGGPHPDDLDPRTAYLYYHYIKGDLEGYNYSSNSHANALQRAMWYIEQETLGVDNWLVALAQEAIDNKEWSGIGNVRVMNMYYYSATVPNHIGGKAQDQLILVPEPSTLLLLGAGLLGLGLLGRRKFKKV